MKKYLIAFLTWINNNCSWFYPVALIVLAMVVNGVAMYFEDGICDDAAKYHTMISNWIKYGNIYHTSVDTWMATTIPPFFLWCVKTLSQSFDLEIFSAARVLNFICGAALPLIFYYILNTFDIKKRYSFFCAVVLACHPEVVYVCTIMTRDCLYFFLALLVVWGAVQGILKKQLWKTSAAGFIFSAAALTRYEAWEMLPCVVIFLLFALWGKYISWQRAAANLAFFILFALAGVALLAFMMEFHPEYIRVVLIRYGERLQGFF